MFSRFGKMTSLATDNQKTAVRKLWKTVFNDTDSFLERYFADVFRTEQTIVCTENDNLKASLQLLPYTIKIKGKSFPAAYFFAVMTDPRERNKGYMRQMMTFAFEVLREKQIPLAFLIPQEEYLFDIYAKYGFEKGFFAEKITENSIKNDNVDYFLPNEDEAYNFYCQFYKNKDRVVLSETQFRFAYNDILLSSGKIVAVKTNGKIAGLCFALPQKDHIKMLDLLAKDLQTHEELLQAASNELGNINCFVVNNLQKNRQNILPVGMFKILDNSLLSPKDLQNCHLSLMMSD
jgi:predicted GNAT family N-acyltransferase